MENFCIFNMAKPLLNAGIRIIMNLGKYPTPPSDHYSHPPNPCSCALLVVFVDVVVVVFSCGSLEPCFLCWFKPRMFPILFGFRMLGCSVCGLSSKV